METDELDREVDAILAREHRARLVALVDGRHFTTYAEQVKALKRDGNLLAAESLLVRLRRAAEAEAEVMGRPTAPWYADQLRIVRKKLAAQASKGK